MISPAEPAADPIDPGKFRDPDLTAAGEKRARVGFDRLAALWFNTGTLCNLTCRNCYVESSPRNDRLSYIAADEVAAYLDEIGEDGLATEEIGLTGGEPFMNPDIAGIVEACLSRGFRVLVLTNAMRPMMKRAAELADLRSRFGARLVLRVSVDHYGPALHERERGPRSWRPTLDGLAWLCRSGFNVHVAARTCWNEPEAEMRAGYARLFAERSIPIDADDPVQLLLLPEMDERADVPEITEGCWEALGVAPGAMMCATSRMVVKRKGAERPVVVPCTLLPYDRRFEMGQRLREAARPVALNHPHCARFCVLGGGRCGEG